MCCIVAKIVLNVTNEEHVLLFPLILACTNLPPTAKTRQTTARLSGVFISETDRRTQTDSQLVAVRSVAAST